MEVNFFEMLNGYYPSQEDRYAQKVADEYGQWLYHTPWYDFPFFDYFVNFEKKVFLL